MTEANVDFRGTKNKLPPSAQEIYKILIIEGPMTTKEVLDRVNYASRTVRYALKKLISLELVRKVPYLLDMRQSKYMVNKKRMSTEKSSASRRDELRLYTYNDYREKIDVNYSSRFD